MENMIKNKRKNDSVIPTVSKNSRGKFYRGPCSLAPGRVEEQCPHERYGADVTENSEIVE